MSSSVQNPPQAESLVPIDTQAGLLEAKQHKEPSVASLGVKYLLARFFNKCTFEKIGFFRNWENESARNLINSLITPLNRQLSKVVSEGLQSLGDSIQDLPTQLKSAHWDPLTRLGTEHGVLVSMTPLGDLGQLGDRTTRFVADVLSDVTHMKGEFANLNQNVIGTAFGVLGALYQGNEDHKHLLDACKKFAFDRIFTSDYMSNTFGFEGWIGRLCASNFVRGTVDHLVTEHILNNPNNNLLKSEPTLFHEKVLSACLRDFQAMGGDALSLSNLKRLFSESNDALSPELRRHVEEFNILCDALSNNLITSTMGKVVKTLCQGVSGTLLPSEQKLGNLEHALTHVLENPNQASYQDLAKACILLFPQAEKFSESIQNRIAELAVSRMQPMIESGNMDRMGNYLSELALMINGTNEIMREIARVYTNSENVDTELVQSLTPRLQHFIAQLVMSQASSDSILAEGTYIGGAVGFGQLGLLVDNPEREEKLCNLLKNGNAESIAAACLDLAREWTMTTAPVRVAREVARVVTEGAQTAGRAVLDTAGAVAEGAKEMAQSATHAVVDVAQTVGSAAVEMAQGAASAVGGAISTVVGKAEDIGSAVVDTTKRVVQGAGDMARGAISTVGEMAQSSVDAVGGAIGAVTEGAQAAGMAMLDAAGAVAEGVRDMARSAASAVGSAAQAVGQAVVGAVGAASSGIERMLGKNSGEDVSAIDDPLAPEVASVQESFHEIMAPPLQQVVNRQNLENELKSMPRVASAEAVRNLNNTTGTETVFQDKGWTWTATYNLNPNISQALSSNALALTHQDKAIEGKNAQEKLKSLHGILAQGSNNDATQGIALLSNIVDGAPTLLPSSFQGALTDQGLSIVTRFQDGSPANPSYSLNITSVKYDWDAIELFADHADNVSCHVVCEYPIQTKDGQLTGERVRISFDVNLCDTPTPGRAGSTRSFNINDIRNLNGEFVGSEHNS